MGNLIFSYTTCFLGKSSESNLAKFAPRRLGLVNLALTYFVNSAKAVAPNHFVWHSYLNVYT